MTSEAIGKWKIGRFCSPAPEASMPGFATGTEDVQEPLALAAWLAISLVKQHNVRETPLGHRATLNSDLGKEFLQRRPGLLRAVIDVVDERLG